MAKIIPFKGLRPSRDKVHLVASRSVDGYKQPELKAKLADNPFTFLHVINPDFTDGKKTKPGSPERLVKVKQRFKDFHQEGIFIKDEIPCFYLYRQQKGDHTYTGIIGCSSIDDYFNGVIKKHEQTLAAREKKLKEYLEVCDINAEPVLFCYPDDQFINGLTDTIRKRIPDYDFTTTDRIRHTLWVVDDEGETSFLKNRFSHLKAVYIADGHHRSASSALLGEERRIKSGSYTGLEGFNYYLGIFFPESQLSIYDYNRLVRDLNGLSVKEFLDRLSPSFTIEEKGTSRYKPMHLHNISLYAEGKWYSLTLKKEAITTSDPVSTLDADILSRLILAPVLDIQDLRTDKRVEFVPGVKGLEAIQEGVDSGRNEAGFVLYPVSMAQLKLIADTNNIMPPKSTWIEPKIRSGLVVYDIGEKVE